MSTHGREQIAADGGTGVLRLALTRGVPLLRLVSEVGRVGVLPFWGSQLLSPRLGKGLSVGNPVACPVPFTLVPSLVS